MQVAIYVLPEQKLNRITNAHCYSICPTCTKPDIGGSFSFMSCFIISILQTLFVSLPKLV
jgi:hypothetical protein